MDYVIKRDRGVWVLELLEGQYKGTRYRFSTKTALLAAAPRISAHLATMAAIRQQ